MEYRIVLQRMEFRALHGCYELERKVGNRFTVDLELTALLGEAAAEDDVEKTVNYLTVYQIVRERMGQTQRTIERVALNIIEALYAALKFSGSPDPTVLKGYPFAKKFIEINGWLSDIPSADFFDESESVFCD